MVAYESSSAQTSDAVHLAVLSLSNPERANLSQRYFKTGPGEYGEGDVFAGLPVPICRQLARNFQAMAAAELDDLISSEVHEERLIALVIHTSQYQKAKADSAKRRELFHQYDRWLAAGRVNNWDLVDVSAPHIGRYLFTDNPATKTGHYLAELSQSPQLWQRRASVIFTFAALGTGDIRPSLEACQRLVNDEHDLIQKAVGWVLREVGKRDISALRAFLGMHAATMPRTALRYAIEKCDPAERQHWLGLRAAHIKLQ